MIMTAAGHFIGNEPSFQAPSIKQLGAKKTAGLLVEANLLDDLVPPNEPAPRQTMSSKSSEMGSLKTLATIN